MNSTSIGVQIAYRFFVTGEEMKKETCLLEEILEDVERFFNCREINLIWEHFLLINWFYDAVYNIKIDPVLTYVTDEWK